MYDDDNIAVFIFLLVITMEMRLTMVDDYAALADIDIGNDDADDVQVFHAHAYS